MKPKFGISFYGPLKTRQHLVQGSEPSIKPTIPVVTYWFECKSRFHIFRLITMVGPPTQCQRDGRYKFDWFKKGFTLNKITKSSVLFHFVLENSRVFLLWKCDPLTSTSACMWLYHNSRNFSYRLNNRSSDRDGPVT